jgi:hypothetical protein
MGYKRWWLNTSCCFHSLEDFGEEFEVRSGSGEMELTQDADNYQFQFSIWTGRE